MVNAVLATDPLCQHSATAEHINYIHSSKDQGCTVLFRTIAIDSKSDMREIHRLSSCRHGSANSKTLAARIDMQDYRLTNYELELMDAIWKRGTATVQEVCDDIDRDLAYTTVMTTLALLCTKKKVLKRVKRGKAFVYKPRITRKQVSQSVIHNLRHVLFGGSLPSLVLDMMSSEGVSDQDIAALKAVLAKMESKS